jgi:hypothetical protein
MSILHLTVDDAVHIGCELATYVSEQLPDPITLKFERVHKRQCNVTGDVIRVDMYTGVVPVSLGHHELLRGCGVRSSVWGHGR